MGGVILQLAEGVGHLWFLPMLFIVFIMAYPIVNHIDKITKWPLLLGGAALLMALSIVPFPLRIGSSCYYLIFFIGGYLCWMNKERIVSYAKPRNIALSWVAFAVVFVLLTLVVQMLTNNMENAGLMNKAFLIAGKNICKAVYPSLGIAAMMLTALRITQKNPLPDWLIKVGGLCMGVYVFQQFILQWVYYHTDMPQTVGNLALPWVGFGIALLGSLLLSHTAKKL